LSEDEIGVELGISERTVKRDWRIAKAWLYGELFPSGRSTSARLASDRPAVNL
jgi:hypothetical protein